MKINWNEVTWYSKTLSLVFLIFVFLFGFWVGQENKKISEIFKKSDFTDSEVKENLKEKSFNLCYLYNEKNKNSGFVDRSWLSLNIKGDEISGEYHNLPSQKDSKIGKFTGSVGPKIEEIMGRKASVIWDTFAEGMNEKEELLIEFGEGSAVAFFGEMVYNGSFYEYKDKINLAPSFQMSQIDCEHLKERLSVEKYLKENISSVAPNTPVLGGSWYVVSVDLDVNQKTGRVWYEDGHIGGNADFQYFYNKSKDEVGVFNFVLSNW